MCVGIKPHPFGKERHTICFGFTSIPWREKIVEGEYFPSQRGAKQHHELGNTVGLMLRMCKPIFGSGKSVIFGSVFFVAKGVVEFETRGVYEGAFIKKRRYWPNNVPGNDIDKKFEGKEVGEADCLETNTDKCKVFNIHHMKELDYVMELMASWMTLNDLEGESNKSYWKENGVRKPKECFCKQPFGM